MKHHKLPENILDLLPDAVDFMRSHPKVVFLYPFGSLAARPPSPLSDVDIAVYLSSGTDFAESKLESPGELMDILQTDHIDLVILNLIWGRC